MSASLVGSEMCIRDSTCSARGSRRHDLARGQTRAPPRRPRDQGAHRPVSYTHLTLPTICSV
eukprot:1117497-Alexandrium_andersonii.AAC.1